MYFIVGKTINQSKQVISYLITDGNGIKEVSPQQVYIEYQKGNLPYLKGINSNTGEIDFKNIDNSLLPTFYNGRGISNSVSVLKILEENGKQIGVRILVASGKIMNVSLPDILKLVSNNKIKLFNAKIVDNKIVMKAVVNKEDTVIDDIYEYGGVKWIRRDSDVKVKDFYENELVIRNRKLVRCSLVDERVIIPHRVTSIEYAVFRNCKGLKSVTIPNSVTSIGEFAFSNCTSLTSITIPNGVTSIGEFAFSNCTSLTSITIPDSVTDIGYGAFQDCGSLTHIIIPNSVTSIGSHVFYRCRNLKSIVIPDSVTSIGDYAFAHCTRLRSITIPDSITNIGEGAFLNCTSLTSIIIPDSVESVGKHAFRYWTSSQTIYIKDVSFAARERSKDWNQECEAKIVLDDESDKLDNRIVAFGNCGKDGDKVIWQLDDKGLLVIRGNGEMEDFSITSDIPWWHEKRESIKTVILKEGVTSIGSSVFTCHTNLRSITIPDSVTSIGASAFYYCGNLTSINISDSVTSIGNWAFEGCQNLCIKGVHGSTVEKYAIDNNIKFEAIK